MTPVLSPLGNGSPAPTPCLATLILPLLLLPLLLLCPLQDTHDKLASEPGKVVVDEGASEVAALQLHSAPPQELHRARPASSMDAQAAASSRIADLEVGCALHWSTGAAFACNKVHAARRLPDAWPACCVQAANERLEQLALVLQATCSAAAPEPPASGSEDDAVAALLAKLALADGRLQAGSERAAALETLLQVQHCGVRVASACMLNGLGTLTPT